MKNPKNSGASAKAPGPRDSHAHRTAPGQRARKPCPPGPRQAEPVHAVPGGAPEGIRLNKAIAASGLCARRKADELVFAGRVSVDGIAELNPGRRVLPGEVIAVDGEPLRPEPEHVYLLLHKPVGTVCTLSDPQGRPTVMDCLPEQARGLGLFPVGRLDYFSEGLLLLTNDGELANRLIHPRHHVDKVYEVHVRGEVPERSLEIMRSGMRLSDGTPLLPVAASRLQAPERGGTLLRLTLRQGVNRQIRRMCDDLGLTILRLRRVAQGILHLGTLRPGETRRLNAEEVLALRKSAGLGEKP